MASARSGSKKEIPVYSRTNSKPLKARHRGTAHSIPFRQKKEVYVKCSVETCAQRDPKGLYKKASSGQIKDLTGPQDLYEEPLQADLVVDTERLTVQESVDSILATLKQLGITRP